MENDGKIHSLAEFVQSVKDARSAWRVPYRRELWFRGEQRDYGMTRLRPTLYRPAEGYDLRPIESLLRTEFDLFESFRKSSVQLSEDPIQEDFDGYLLMQHHGAPTRLLDWSDGCLMALHFALRPTIEMRDQLADCVVYVLDPNRLIDRLEALPEYGLLQERWTEYVQNNPAENFDKDDQSPAYMPDNRRGFEELELPRTPMVLQFPNITRRVAAQRSQFIVFGSSPSWLSEDFERPESVIKVITIKGKAKRSIRNELREAGITESVIFPDLDGLGRELAQMWRERR